MIQAALQENPRQSTQTLAQRVGCDPITAQWIRGKQTERDYAIRPVVYAIGPLGVGLTKIGYTRDVSERLSALQYMSPVHLTLLWATEGDAWLEAHLHKAFAAQRVQGEWFDLGPDPVQAISEVLP